MKKFFPFAVAALFCAPVVDASPLSGEIILGSYSNKAEFAGESSGSESSTGIGLRGVYQFNENVAAEAAWLNFGEAKWQEVDEWGDLLTDKVTARALTFGIKGIFPVNDKFSLNARLGLALWDIDWKYTDSGWPQDNISFSEDGSDLYFGFGGEFQLTPQVYIGAAYNHLKADISLLGLVSIDYTINGFQGYVGYRF